MTATAFFPFENDFSMEFTSARKIINSTRRIADRIAKELFCALEQEGIQEQVDQNFDVIISSANNRLKKFLPKYQLMVVGLEALVSSLKDEISSDSESKQPIPDIALSFFERSIPLIKFLELEVFNTREQIEATGINRASVGESVEILYEIEQLLSKMNCHLSQVVEYSNIYNALLEKPSIHSDIPELVALLG